MIQYNDLQLLICQFQLLLLSHHRISDIIKNIILFQSVIQYLMNQEKQKIVSTVGKSLFLDTVIDCITQKRNSPSKKQEVINQQPNNNLNSLYGKADNLIAEFDTEINRCIKYNEAKTNRKYEIIITDLQTQIKKLKDKLKLEQDARSPTKKHISDILDKLVVYRDQNFKLKEDVKVKQSRISNLQEEVQLQKKALQKIQYQQPKAIVQRLPALSNMGSVSQAIKSYLKDKQMVKKITNKSTSKLQRFLAQNKAKAWNWSVPVLLQELDKWTEGVNLEKGEVDMWKIRSNIARKFSDYMDDSGKLTKPSRLSNGSNTQSIMTPRQQKYFSNRKLSNYSYNGSKQQLNISII